MVEFCCSKGYILNGSSVSECDTVKREWEPVAGTDCVRKFVMFKAICFKIPYTLVI